MHVRVVGRRRRVLRRRDARAAAQADRRGDRRPLLHAGQRRGAARGDQLQRPRRHGRRRARAVGHAGAVPDAGRPRSPPSGATAACGAWRESRREQTAETRRTQRTSSQRSLRALRFLLFAVSWHVVRRAPLRAADAPARHHRRAWRRGARARSFRQWATTFIERRRRKTRSPTRTSRCSRDKRGDQGGGVDEGVHRSRGAA